MANGIGTSGAPDILNRYIEGVDENAGAGNGRVSLTPEQEKAREEGYSQSSLGVVRPSFDRTSPLLSEPRLRISGGTASAQPSSETSDEPQYYAAVEGDVDAASLHSSMLGSTKYAELKRAVGIPQNASFTDWYDAGGVIPSGYAKEAKLLLAEERRVGLYEKHLAGELSETDFLWRAYGKDLLERDGYYLDSSLWWYNRHKSGDFSNPVDSVSLVESVVENARTLWQAETWFREKSSKSLGDTFQGYVTGNWLSDSQFYEAFKSQVDALKPYFNDSVSKVLAYYKAGYLGSAFSPFVDIDGDGKYDYYFHTDGRMYAVDDSSGVGQHKCRMKYNDNGSVHSIQILDGFDGPIDSFFEGFRDFFVGFLDLGSFVVSAITGIADAAQGGNYFTDSQARWEAFKKSTWALGDKDYVTFAGGNPFDGSWDAEDWGNAIASGIGTVAGMVVLTLATAGLGNAPKAANDYAKESAKAIAEGYRKTGSTAWLNEAISSATTNFADNAGKDLGKKGLAEFNRTLYKELITHGMIPKELVKDVGKGTLGYAAKQAIAKRASMLIQAGQKARSGFVIKATGLGGGVWGQSIQIAATSAIKDLIQVGSSLEANNYALRYLEDATGGQVKALSHEEMWGRAAIVAGADLFISSIFRATGTTGITTRMNAIRNRLGKVGKGVADQTAAAIYKSVDKNVRSVISNMTDHMVRDMWIDNAADIFENITTAAVQAAASNPLVRTGEDVWSSIGQTLISPSTFITNLYIGINNAFTFGPKSQSMMDQRITQAIEAFNLNEAGIRNAIPNIIRNMNEGENASDPSVVETVRTLRSAQAQIEAMLDEKGTPAQHLSQTVKAARQLDILLSDADEKTVRTALGVDGEKIAQIRKAMSNAKFDLDANTWFTGKIFLDAKTVNRKSVLDFYEQALNDAVARSNKISLRYRDNIWAEVGKLKGDQQKMNRAMRTMADFVSSISKKNNDVAINVKDDDYMKIFVAKRLQTLAHDENAQAELLKLFQDPDSPLRFHELSPDAAMPNATIKVVQDDKGDVTKLVWMANGKELGQTEVDNMIRSNPLLALFLDYKNNQASIEKLNGLFRQTGAKNVYEVITGGVPWFAIAFDPSKRNDILENKNARAFLNALETVSLLFEDGSGFDGFPLADYDVDMLSKFEVSYKNSSGEDTTQTIFIIPNRAGSTLSETVNRIQAAQGFLYGVAKLQSMLVLGTSDYEEYTRELTKLGILLKQDEAFNNLEDFESRWKKLKEQDQLSRQYMKDSITALLNNSDFSKPGDETYIGRRQILTLYRKGILSDELIDDMITSHPNDAVRKSLDALKRYVDLDGRVRDMDSMLIFSKNNRLGRRDLEKIKKLSQDLSDDKNAEIRKALEEDGRIGKRVLKALEDPEETLNFLLGLSERSALRLTLEGSSERAESRIGDDKDIRNLLIGLANQSVGKAKRAFTQFSKSINSANAEIAKAERASAKPLTYERKAEIKQSKILEGLRTNFIDFVSDFNGSKEKKASQAVASMIEIVNGSSHGAKTTIGNDGLIRININGEEHLLSDYVERNANLRFLVSDESYAKQFADGLIRSAKRYEDYILTGTTLTESENLVTVDLYEIVPEKLRKAVIAMQESMQANLKLSQITNEKELVRLRDRLIGGGAATTQLKAWNELLTQYSDSDGMLRFDLDSPAQMRKFGEVMQKLGYDNDVQRILSGQEYIEGVNLYNRERHSIVVNDCANVRDVLSAFARTQMVKGKKDKDVGGILRYAFANAQLMKPDTKVTLPKHLFGLARKVDQNALPISVDGLTFEQRNTKANLQASEGSKTNRVAYNSIAFDGEVDQRSAETFNLLKAVTAVFGYAKDTTEYQSFMAMPYSDALWKAVDKFYGDHKDTSIIKPEVFGDENSGRTIVFSFDLNGKSVDAFMKHATKDGFDIKELIPIWGEPGTIAKESRKTRDFRMSDEASAETVVSVLLQQDIAGFNTINDLSTMSREKVDAGSYYAYDNDAFTVMTTKKGGRAWTFGELSALFDDPKSDINKAADSNYELNLLRSHIISMRRMNEVIESQIGADLLPFADGKSMRILGDLLAKPEFKLITTGEADGNLIRSFASEFNETYKSAFYDDPSPFADSIATYDDEFTSSSVSKYSPKSDPIEITESNVIALMGLIKSYMKSYDYVDGFGVPMHSALRTSMSFARFAEDGSMRINMEDWINAPKADREAFIEFVRNELIGNAKGLGLSESTVKDLVETVKTLVSKNEAIDEMGANKGLDLSIGFDRIRYEPPSSDVPSVEPDPSSYVFMTGNVMQAKSELELLATMAANRVFRRSADSKFIRSSALDLGDMVTPHGYGAFMAGLLDGTSYKANDKSGSTMVYNMRSSEGAGEFLMQVESFADFATELLAPKITGGKVNKKDLRNALAELGAKMSLYTSGATFASEYAGAFLFRYNTEKNEFDIRPINLSSSKPEDNIYASLLFKNDGETSFDQIKEASEQGIRTFLFRADKNAFVNNSSGYATDMQVFDMNDPKVVESALLDALSIATDGMATIRTAEDKTKMTPEEILTAYYGRTLRLNDIRNNVIAVCSAAGMPSNLIDEILPTVRNLSVMQPTKFRDEKLKGYVSGFIDSLKGKVPNHQLKVLQDAVLYGVTYSSIGLNGRIALENLQTTTRADMVDSLREVFAQKIASGEIKKEYSYEPNPDPKKFAKKRLDELDDIVSGLLDPDVSDEYKKAIGHLTDDERKYVVKSFMMRRRSGKDIAAILSSTKGSVLDYVNGISPNDDKLDWDTDNKSGGSNPKSIAFDDIRNHATVMYDSEWLFKYGSDDRSLYQWSFIIRSKVGGKKKFNVIVKSGFDASSDKDAGWKHTESDESFARKNAYTSKKAKTFMDKGATVFIAKDPVEALTYFVDRCEEEGVEVRMAYNNKAEGSDDSWFDLLPAETRKKLDEMSNFDLREDGITKIYSEKTERLNTESIDSFVKAGIIQRKGDAHDSMADTELLEDIEQLVLDRVNTKPYYTSLKADIGELTGLKDGELDDFLSKLNFGKLMLNADLTEALTGVQKLEKGNTFIKSILDAVNTSYEYQAKREANKSLREAISDVLHPVFGRADRERLISSAKSEWRRKAFTGVFIKVLASKGGNPHDFATAEGAPVRKTVDSFIAAFNIFKDDVDSDYDRPSNQRLFDRFVSLPIEELKSYLAKADQTLAGKLDVIEGDEVSLSKAQYENLKKQIDFESSYEDEVRTNAYNRILSPIADMVYGKKNKDSGYAREVVGDKNLFGEDGVLSDQTKDYLAYALWHVYGVTDETRERLAEKDESSKLYKKNLLKDGFREDVIDYLQNEVFGKSLIQSLAAWKMAQEKREFTHDQGEFGVVYVGENALKKMPGFTINTKTGKSWKAGDEFYTTMWRQPGQQATVIHSIKVVVTNNPDEFAMTRTTSKTYFNGDMDGDFYYITPPDEASQRYGERLFEFLTVGGNILDDLMKEHKTLAKKGKHDQMFLEKSSKVKAVFDALSEKDCARLLTGSKEALDEFNSKLLTDIGEEKADTYGITLHKGRSGQNIMTCHAPFLEEYLSNVGTKKAELATKLIEGNQAFVRFNILDDSYIDQVFGVMSKNIKPQALRDIDVSKLTYVSTLAIPEESYAYLAELCSDMSKPDKRKIHDNMVKKLNATHLSDGEKSSVLAAVDNALGLGKGQHAEMAQRLIAIAKITQLLELRSAGFGKVLSNEFKEELDSKTEEMAEKVTGALSMLNDLGFDVGELSDEEMNSIPAMLAKMSSAFVKINGERAIKNALSFSDRDSSVASRLFADFLTKANVEENVKNGMHVIGSKGRTVISGKEDKFRGVGLASEMYVAVRSTEDRTDTTVLLKKGASQYRVGHCYKPVEFKDLTPKNRRDILDMIQRNGTGGLDGRKLAKVLGVDADIRESSRFSAVLVDRAGNKFGKLSNKEDWIDRNCVLVIHEMTNLYDAGLGKIGIPGTKNMKTTMQREGDITIPASANGHEIAMIIPGSKLKYQNQTSSGQNFEPSMITVVGKDGKKESVVETIVGSDGQKYSIVKISNAALLSVLDQNEAYTSLRDMDPISILSGSRGADAILSFGELFFSWDGNEFSYDPSGYTALRDAVSKTPNDRVEDVNGADLVRVSRIATYMSMLPKEGQEEFLTFISQKLGMNINNPKAAIDELLKRGDVGSSFGKNAEAKGKKLIREYGLEPELEKLLDDKANVWQRVVFSHDVEEALSDDILSRAEDSGEPIPGKKQKLNANQKMLSMRRSLNNIFDLARSENGGKIDGNDTTFISRKALLRMMLDESKEKESDVGLIVSTLKEMNSLGMVEFEKVHRGNRANNYHSILDRHARDINKPNLDKRLIAQMKKSGAYGNYEDRFVVNEANEEIVLPRHSTFPEARDFANGYGLSDMEDSFSPWERAIEDADEKVKGSRWSSYKRKSYGNMANTRLMAMLSDGSDEELYDALTGFRGQFEIDRTTPYATLSQSGDGLSIQPRFQGEETVMTARSAQEALNEANKSPKMLRLQQKNLADMTTVISPSDLEIEDQDVRLTLLGQRSISDYYKEANERIAAAISEYAEEPTLGTIRNSGILYTEMKTLSSDHLIKLAGICADDNGMEAIWSLFRSWGWKAKNNADFGLGSQQVRMGMVASKYAEQLLGKDMALLSYVGRNNRDALLLLNEGMRTQYILDVYDELTSNKATHVRRLGEKAYAEHLDECVQALGGDVEGIRAQLNESMLASPSLKTMFEAAKNITARLMEEAKKQNPFAIVGWYVAPPKKQRKPLFAKFGSYMNVYRYGNEPSVATMLEEGFGKQRTRFGTALYDESLGFIGNVIRVATDLSKKKALNDFGSYMRSNGFMSNSKTFSIAEEALRGQIGQFRETFEKAYATERDAQRREAMFQNDAYTYGVLQYSALNAGIDAKPNYEGPQDFVDLFEKLSHAWARASDGRSFGEYQADAQASVGDDRAQYEIGMTIYNAYMNTMATMVSMMSEGKGGTAAFLNSIYARARAEIGDDFVFVDKNGAMLMPTDKTRGVPTYTEFDVDDAIKAYRFGEDMTDDQKRAEIAKMMLTGDVYVMRKSLADQLDRKVFTSKMHGMVHAAIKKSKSILTSLIMSSPVQLLDRWVNFPLFDIGIDAGANYKTLRHIPEATAAINKLVALGDNLTQADLDSDPNLQYLVRFITASNQDLRSSDSIRGEKVGTSNIPLIKQYIKMANLGYNIGNSIPRFAYFLNMVKDAEKTGNGIDPTRMGVAFHMREGISKIQGHADDEVYSRYGDKAQEIADLDAQAIQIIAEHNGFEGNMPYFSKYLSENYNAMFISFPMALVRWGVNRVQSLGYAFSTMAESATSRKYLLNQVGSVLLTQAILLGLQLMLSSNTFEWLKKKGSGKDDEITEEEQEAASNILFKGGCVKIFDTLRSGKEVTTTGHNRGPVSALFDSYIADFLPENNNGNGPDFKTLWYALTKHTWGHVPFIVKDTVESIPGNKAIQSTSWAEPGDNFFENIGRKVLGYGIGSQAAKSTFDYMSSAKDSTDQEFLERLFNGMRYAYSTKFSNTKESKSNWKNYRKAFSLIYDYKKLTKRLDSETFESSDKASYSDLKSKFVAAIRTQNNVDSLLHIVVKAKEDGISLSTIRSALKAASLKQQIKSLGNYDSFLSTLSESEEANLKSALLYEDQALSFIDDAWDDVQQAYAKSRESQDMTDAYPSISSIVYQRNKNIKSNYQNARLSNSNYGLLTRNYGQDFYKGTANGPMDAYLKFERDRRNSIATDIYGNRYTRYTNGRGDSWTYKKDNDK